jgi:uncharacterized membrane protein
MRTSFTAALPWTTPPTPFERALLRARRVRDRAAPAVYGAVRHTRDAAEETIEELARRVREADRRVLLAGGVLLVGSAVLIGVLVARSRSESAEKGETDAPAKADGKSRHPDYIERAVTVNIPREQAYREWRDLAGLPRFMEIVESVTEDGDRSHWVFRGPGDKRLEFDAVITEDRPGEAIAWESLPGAPLHLRSRVEFKDAPGGRGTEVHAKVDYKPAFGPLGRLAALITQKAPELQSRRDLKRFKQLMETGEIATTEGPGAAPSSRDKTS